MVGWTHHRAWHRRLWGSDLGHGHDVAPPSPPRSERGVCREKGASVMSAIAVLHIYHWDEVLNPVHTDGSAAIVRYLYSLLS